MYVNVYVCAHAPTYVTVTSWTSKTQISHLPMDHLASKNMGRNFYKLSFYSRVTAQVNPCEKCEM